MLYEDALVRHTHSLLQYIRILYSHRCVHVSLDKVRGVGIVAVVRHRVARVCAERARGSLGWKS